jgi:3-hydroxyisobutyrate dehydrogenase-like beta-hydroxyacid dehydrogenase
MVLAEATSIELEVAFDVIKIGADYAPMLKYRHLIYLDETANVLTFTVELSRKNMDTAVVLVIIFGANVPQGRKFELIETGVSARNANLEVAALLN